MELLETPKHKRGNEPMKFASTEWPTTAALAVYAIPHPIGT